MACWWGLLRRHGRRLRGTPANLHQCSLLYKCVVLALLGNEFYGAVFLKPPSHVMACGRELKDPCVSVMLSVSGQRQLRERREGRGVSEGRALGVFSSPVCVFIIVKLPGGCGPSHAYSSLSLVEADSTGRQG